MFFEGVMRQPTMTEEKKHSAGERKPFGGCKIPKHSIAGGGNQANLFEKKTQSIGEHVGREYGQLMRVLVLQLKEATLPVPQLPKNPDEQQKLMWGKDCDMYLKKQDRYEENKAKVFAFILGQCDEGMKNKLQSDSTHETIDDTFDVISLLKLMKDAAYDAHDKKSPALQAVAAWKQLLRAFQKENESLLDYCKRLQSLVERVELLCGGIEPVKVAERDPKYAKSKTATIEKEKGKMLAVAFVEGADKSFKPLLNDLEQDCSLGDDKCPATVEEALQVL